MSAQNGGPSLRWHRRGEAAIVNSLTRTQVEPIDQDAKRLVDRRLDKAIIQSMSQPKGWKRAQRQLSNRLRYNGLHMEGRPYRVSPRPMLIERAESDQLADRLSLVHEVLEHTADMYAQHPEVRDLFASYAGSEPEILSYPRARPIIQVARLDCAWSGGSEFRILEVNSACPSGVVQIPIATGMWLETEWAQRLLAGFEHCPYPLLADPHAFARALVSSAERAGHQVTAVAVVNVRGVYTNEIEWIVRRFRELGLEAQICDARSIRERASSAWCAGQHYQLVYNKLDPLTLLADSDMSSYRRMLARHRAFFVNPLVAQTIVEDKGCLALLSDPRYEAMFSIAQRAVIDSHVPWTRLMRRGRTTDPDGVVHDLFDYVARNRPRLVLKPANLTRGQGVLVGLHTTDSVWSAALGAAVSARYVVQQYVPLPVMHVPTGDGTRLEPVYVDLSCHMLAGRLAGYFSRCSVNPVVNMGAGGHCVPVIQVASQESTGALEALPANGGGGPA
jgi:glutathionylspermidine synthase